MVGRNEHGMVSKNPKKDYPAADLLPPDLQEIKTTKNGEKMLTGWELKKLHKIDARKMTRFECLNTSCQRASCTSSASKNFDRIEKTCHASTKKLQG
mmetsp:Transcript_4897/g.7779  ORF Transcript_4897/g.7779 Transcript_4897/m.7779 type:complete len:97 (-) Transcript_4897:756-1046(-)